MCTLLKDSISDPSIWTAPYLAQYDQEVDRQWSRYPPRDRTLESTQCPSSNLKSCRADNFWTFSSPSPGGDLAVGAANLSLAQTMQKHDDTAIRYGNTAIRQYDDTKARPYNSTNAQYMIQPLSVW